MDYYFLIFFKSDKINNIWSKGWPGCLTFRISLVLVVTIFKCQGLFVVGCTKSHTLVHMIDRFNTNYRYYCQKCWNFHTHTHTKFKRTKFYKGKYENMKYFFFMNVLFVEMKISKLNYWTYKCVKVAKPNYNIVLLCLKHNLYISSIIHYQSSRFIDNVQRVTKKQTLRPILQVFNNRSHLEFGLVLLDTHQGFISEMPWPDGIRLAGIKLNSSLFWYHDTRLVPSG
jgi:hypothetical protein